MAISITTTTPPNWYSDEWEIINDDGFVFKREKRRIDPTSLARAADPDPDPALEIKAKRKRKHAALLILKERYNIEITLWDNLSNILKAMEGTSKSKQQQVVEKGAGEEKDRGISVVSSVEKCSGSLVDELLLQAEAQEAIIHSFEQLCDVAESLCNAHEEKEKERFFDLPIWSSPHELMASLIED